MMKRYGASLRRRFSPTLLENARPSGPLTEEEISAVRRAYENGCCGEIVIGMRGKERIITMLVPQITDSPISHRMAGIKDELKKIGCDGVWRIRAGGNTDAA